MTVVIVPALVYITPVPAVVKLDNAVVAPMFLRFRFPVPALKLSP